MKKAKATKLGPAHDENLCIENQPATDVAQKESASKQGVQERAYAKSFAEPVTIVGLNSFATR